MKIGWPVLLALLLTSSAALRQEPASDPGRLGPLIAESLPLLQASSRTWLAKRSCVSCHHQALGLVTAQVARASGIPLDETMVAEQIARVRDNLRGGRAEALQGFSNINGQIGQAYRLWGMAAWDQSPDAETDSWVHFLAGLQHPDGHWLSESHRPPLEDSEFTATALTVRAMQLYAPPGRAAEIAQRVQRAHAWLVGAAPRGTENCVMQIFGLAWSGGTAAEIAAASAELLREQRPDGGWAQIATRDSDAYATGQALVTLNQTGGLSVGDAAYARGLDFLLRTRLADGTWLVKTRRCSEGLQYFETGFPHGVDQFISYPGTCWAVLALCLKVHPQIYPAFMRTAPIERRTEDALAKQNEEGMTPLMVTCLYENTSAVAALLQSGADPKAKSEHGLTALMCVGGSTEKARLLLARGAAVNARSELLYTPLILAAGYDGGQDLVQLLIERGADVNAAAENGFTALIMAARSGNRKSVDLLLAAGAGVNASMDEDLTALSYATTQNDAAMARHLLEHGAWVDAGIPSGSATPLTFAVIDGMPEVVEVLLQHGAQIDARDELGYTPLLWAATVNWGDSQVLQSLLGRGADLHASTTDGLTALSQATVMGNVRHAELLRRAGAGDPVVAWLRGNAIGLPERAGIPADFDAALSGVRVVGLGEATHGQHESFELKRRITMHLVREQGFRLVAYEASSSRARACDDYVAGRSSDLQAAMSGLGMMIWNVEENAALLDDLRAWNASAAPADRVRFVGVDVQDAGAAAGRLHDLLAEHAPELAKQALQLGPRMDAARDALYSGQAAEFDALWAEIEEMRSVLQKRHTVFSSQAGRAVAEETLLRGRELTRFMSAARTPAGRDRAMAEMLLEELAQAGEQSRAVLWAHNGHVSIGPLRYLNVGDPGMGGVLRASLGDAYYAAGFLFGEGTFNALARDPERGWEFRSYSLSAAPAHSLEAPFLAARIGVSFVNLRQTPRAGEVSEWLDGAHGQRWFGGYQVPDDADAQTRDAANLMKTTPRQDYDGLIYLPKTTPSRPR